MQRRTFLGSLASGTSSVWGQDFPRRVPEYEAPLFHLHTQFSSPIRIAKAEYLLRDKEGFLRITSSEGATGIIRTKEVKDAAIPNIGSFLEFPHRELPKPASWYTPNLRIVSGMLPVPSGPGLGVDFDPDYLNQARLVEAAK